MNLCPNMLQEASNMGNAISNACRCRAAVSQQCMQSRCSFDSGQKTEAQTCFETRNNKTRLRINQAQNPLAMHGFRDHGMPLASPSLSPAIPSAGVCSGARCDVRRRHLVCFKRGSPCGVSWRMAWRRGDYHPHFSSTHYQLRREPRAAGNGGDV